MLNLGQKSKMNFDQTKIKVPPGPVTSEDSWGESIPCLFQFLEMAAISQLLVALLQFLVFVIALPTPSASISSPVVIVSSSRISPTSRSLITPAKSLLPLREHMWFPGIRTWTYLEAVIQPTTHPHSAWQHYLYYNDQDNKSQEGIYQPNMYLCVLPTISAGSASYTHVQPHNQKQNANHSVLTRPRKQDLRQLRYCLCYGLCSNIVKILLPAQEVPTVLRQLFQLSFQNYFI